MPIACGQTISQPYVVAYMTEQLDVTREHRVLEVGTGSGYQAAVLSRLAARGGHGRALSHARRRRAQARWQTLGYDNVDGAASATGSSGAPAHAPYDRIIVTAAAESVPQALVDAARRRRHHGPAARPA